MGSMSKSYGLAGLRLGWIASRNRQLLTRCNDYRMHTTICSSAPSEFLWALALRHRHILTARNLAIVHRNLPLLDAFFERHRSLFSVIKPDASSICFPQLNIRGDVTEFCDQFVAETGVMLLPGAVYDLPRCDRRETKPCSGVVDLRHPVFIAVEPTDGERPDLVDTQAVAIAGRPAQALLIGRHQLAVDRGDLTVGADVHSGAVDAVPTAVRGALDDAQHDCDPPAHRGLAHAIEVARLDLDGLVEIMCVDVLL
jgi:hypothetical protein